LAEVLSQAEIDALLSAINSGDVDANTMQASSASKERQIRVYDFRRQNKFSKEHIRTLSMIHENFARILATQISAHLRMVVHLEVASVEQLTYDEFIRSVPNPTIINIFSLPPLMGNCIFELSADMASSIIDRMLGGPGRSSKMRRDLTEIERALIGTIIAKVLDAFKEAWSSVANFSPRHESMETNPRFIQIVPPTDVVALITFEARFGDATGPISLCIPYVVLESIISKISSQMMFAMAKQEQSPLHAQHIRQKVENAKVPLQVVLGSTEVTVGELVRLGLGDVVPLASYVEQDLPIMVGEKLKFRGRPGTVRNKLAIQITDVAEDREWEDE
jgi:flagellar motor switch protein FliM